MNGKNSKLELELENSMLKKDLIEVLSVANLKLLKVLPCPQK